MPSTGGQSIIENELARRVARNPRYSMRAFARSLGVSHTLLSLVLSGRRRLSRKMVDKLADRLQLSPDERRALAGAERAPADSPAEDFDRLSLDTFALLSDWYHFAILSLLEISGSRLEPRWISRTLAISELEARLAISRLKRLKLIARKDGKWKQCSRPLAVENTLSTAATRKHQMQILRKAEESIENDPFERRDCSSITLAMDPRHVEYARKRIRSFRRKLALELESLGQPREVYHLAVQIYPVSRVERERG